MITPNGISTQDFADILDTFRRIVGAEGVITAEDPAIDSYRDTYTPLNEDDFIPSAAIAPISVKQVQNVVKIANEHNIPLWTIGAGNNFAYGGPAPRLKGFVVLDLKRMKKIIEVDEASGYALVEPGVTYFDLYNHLQKTGSKLWIDCAAPGWGSVLGNALERGVGYTPYGDHFTMTCGMEVVLADGTLMRTGMGAMPGSNTWQLFKWGFGPWVDGLFSQSNMGIVTKLGIWLMPEPPGVMPFQISFPREDDLHQIMEILRPLKINMIIPNAAVIAHAIWEGGVKVTKADYYDGKGPLPDSALKRLISDLDIGMWNLYGSLYGPPPIMEATWSVIKDAFSAISGTKFFRAEDRIGDITFEYRAKLMRGEPNMTEFNLLNWTGGGGHIDFSPISPTTGDDAVRQYEMIKKKAHAYGFDYIGEFAIGWRDLHHVFMLMFDRYDEEEKRRAHQLFGKLIEDAASAGYGEYRTHLAYMDQVAGTYSFNNNALLRTQEKIKDALDPKGILSPGKMGIWPRHLRK